MRVRPLIGGIFAWKDAGLDVEAVSGSELSAVARGVS